jgi:hypothetical protein
LNSQIGKTYEQTKREYEAALAQRAEAAKAAGQEPPADPAFPLADTYAKVPLNPNALSGTIELAGSDEENAADEQGVRDVAAFLQTLIVPALAKDLEVHGMEPTDSKNLVTILHQSGVNVRYLGAIAANMSSHKSRNYLACVREMIVRAAKHDINAVCAELIDTLPSATLLLAILNGGCVVCGCVCVCVCVRARALVHADSTQYSKLQCAQGHGRLSQ